MEKREEILAEYIPAMLFGKYENTWSGGTKHFEGATLEALEKLLAAGLIDAEEAQNSSPTVAEFMEVMRSHPSFRAHGYIVSEERDDARTSLEGLSGYVTYADFPSVQASLGHADEFNIEDDGKGYQVYCWWD